MLGKENSRKQVPTMKMSYLEAIMSLEWFGMVVREVVEIKKWRVAAKTWYEKTLFHPDGT